MRKLLLSVFVAFAAMMSASAQYASVPEVFAKNPDQVVPGLKYSQLKNLYNPKDAAYLADPEYGTGRAWLNLLVPGLAQYTMGEGGLGTRYLLFGLLGEGLVSLAAYDSYMDDIDPHYTPIFSSNSGDYYWIPVFGGAAILITNYICSISNDKCIFIDVIFNVVLAHNVAVIATCDGSSSLCYASVTVCFSAISESR